jgi:hypothetical protein
MLSGSMPAGGLAVFHFRLLPMWGASRAATLQVNCALDKAPDPYPTEGIRLAFSGGGGEPDDEVSGHTVFILTAQAASSAPRSAAVQDKTGLTPAEVHP